MKALIMQFSTVSFFRFTLDSTTILFIYHLKMWTSHVKKEKKEVKLSYVDFNL